MFSSYMFWYTRGMMSLFIGKIKHLIVILLTKKQWILDKYNALTLMFIIIIN